MSEAKKYRHFTNGRDASWRWDGEKMEAREFGRWVPSIFKDPADLQGTLNDIEEEIS